VWAGVDNAWEQKKLEARKMLENVAESHTSGARFVGTLLTLRLTCFYQPSTSPRISFCLDGQCLSEYEQNTQQSPSLGRSIAPQLEHLYKTTQVSGGICSLLEKLQCGQVITASSSIIVAFSLIFRT